MLRRNKKGQLVFLMSVINNPNELADLLDDGSLYRPASYAM
jgi:hypothetical protein